MKKVLYVGLVAVLGVFSSAVYGIPDDWIPAAQVKTVRSVKELKKRIDGLRSAGVNEDYVKEIETRWALVLSRETCPPRLMNDLRRALGEYDRMWEEQQAQRPRSANAQRERNEVDQHAQSRPANAQREQNEVQQNPEELEQELVAIIRSGNRNGDADARLIPYRKAFLNEQNEEEVKRFYDSLSSWNKQCFDMLAIKPLILRDFLARFDNNENRFVQNEIPGLYNAFEGLPQLQDILVKASFKRIVSLPIFCSLIRKYQREVPDSRPIEASIILFGLTPEKTRLGLQILDDLIDNNVISLQKDVSQGENRAVYKLRPLISPINFASTEIERVRRIYALDVAKTDLLNQLVERITKFEKFIKALQTHMSELTVASDKIDLNFDGIAINGLGAIDTYEKADGEDFISSSELFNLWKRKFEPLFLNNEIRRKLVLRVGGSDVTAGVTYPYLRISSDGIESVRRIVYQATDGIESVRKIASEATTLCLIEYLYSISFINVMSKTYTQGVNNDLLLYKAVLEEKYYPAENDVSSLDNYTIDLRTASGNFSSDALENLIDAENRSLVRDERTLKRTLAYYLLKYIYFSAIKRSDGVEYRGAEFPNFRDDDLCIENARMAVIEALLKARYNVDNFEPLNVVDLLRIWRDINSRDGGELIRRDDGREKYPQIDALAAANGDIDGNSFVDGIDAILWDLVFGRYGGTTTHNILNGELNKMGIFASPSISRFSVYILKRMLSENITSELLTNPDLQILFGNLTNRFAHCNSGGFEGSLYLFEEMFKHYNSHATEENRLQFDQLTKVALYLSAFNLLKDWLNFKNIPSIERGFPVGNTNAGYGHVLMREISLDKEEASRFAFALSMLGCRGHLLNMPEAENNITFLDEGNLLISNMKKMLMLMGIAPNRIADNIRVLFNAAKTLRDHPEWTNEQLGGGEADPILVPFLRPFSSLALSLDNNTYGNIWGLAENLDITESDKRRLKLCFSIHKILLQYDQRIEQGNYDEKICEIAKKIINPSAIIDELLKEQNQSFASMLFDSYKSTRPSINDLHFSELSAIDRKKALFDMLNSAGVLTMLDH